MFNEKDLASPRKKHSIMQLIYVYTICVHYKVYVCKKNVQIERLLGKSSSSLIMLYTDKLWIANLSSAGLQQLLLECDDYCSIHYCLL